MFTFDDEVAPTSVEEEATAEETVEDATETVAEEGTEDAVDASEEQPSEEAA